MLVGRSTPAQSMAVAHRHAVQAITRVARAHLIISESGSQGKYSPPNEALSCHVLYSRYALAITVLSLFVTSVSNCLFVLYELRCTHVPFPLMTKIQIRVPFNLADPSARGARFEQCKSVSH